MQVSNTYSSALFSQNFIGSSLISVKNNLAQEAKSDGADLARDDSFSKSNKIDVYQDGTNEYKKDAKETAQLNKLQARDSEVKAHEMAHKSVGGSLAGGMSFEYQVGPDGKQYAVGGEVSIDTSSENDPKATEAKMRQVRAAALAPASPSPQDIKVAGSATMLEMKARMEELKNQQKEVSQTSKDKAVSAYSDNMPVAS